MAMKSIFTVFKRGLQRTKTSLLRQIQATFGDLKHWDEDAFDELEAALISADLGVDVSVRLVSDIRDRYERGEISTSEQILDVARTDLVATLHKAEPGAYVLPATRPTIILMVGVNGSGKTTTSAKLAHLFKHDGNKVMLAACDTFRAAGVQQLQIWAERVGCEVVAGRPGGDAAAAAFDATVAAIARNVDVLIIDTAGRQHTRRELMAELEKIRRTVAKACPGAPHEVWLTVDASTGTNALIQAREFGRVCDISGLILSKLDGTGKGGVVVAIAEELKHPVRFVGLGEAMDDLQPFDADMFARAVFNDTE